MRSIVFRTSALATGCLVALAVASPAMAQTTTQGTTPEAATPTGAATPDTGAALATDDTATTGSREILVTGSRIKQDPNRSALPLEIITNEVIERNGISSPEQLNMYLTSSSTGPDNLASNADVVTGAQRGTNGLSSANLRGQGSGATLVLLNGRRVAAHGLSGSAVDVNQIPFQAIDRVEVLKDGASAIYGTDAIGGVINYITRKDYQGVGASGYVDIPEHGGGEIYSVSGIAGYGDLASQGFNIMGAVGYRWNNILRGSDRDFVNGNQPNRGLSIDTRGTPIATIFNIGANPNQTPNGTLLTGLTLTAPNGANAAAGGINILDLPGGAGCETMDGGMAYDEKLWATPTAYYACAWDTGRAAVIQQPIRTLTYYGRGTLQVGSSEVYAEVTGSDAHSAKSFSNAQLTANTTNLPWAYPLIAGRTDVTYNQIFNALLAAFPANAAALQARYGLPISGRWRCVACGPREYVTDSKTFRAAAGVDGPLPWGNWDYRTGVSYATSEVSSVLGSGYYYRGTLDNNPATPANEAGLADPRAPIAPGATQPGLLGVINAGLINPFSLEQTAAGLAALDAVSAEGTTLYGGRYKTLQADASVSGALFDLPGGPAQIALGVDYRRETYEFNGSDAAVANQPIIFLAAFDNVNALTPKHRTVKAAYAEISLPVFDMLEVNGAVRVDDYTGFGSTVNPKVSAKFTPFEWLMFRGSYSTGFRVPSFNQIFNGTTESPYQGKDLADPTTCPPSATGTQTVNNGTPGCVQINPNVLTGGNLNLGPETAKMYSVGAVLRPLPRWSLSADYYSIAVDDTIASLTLQQLLLNYQVFDDRFIRDGSNAIVQIDQRNINAGSRRTKGVEFALRGSIPAGTGSVDVGMDGSLLLQKKEKLTPSSPYGPSLIGVFTFTGDLGLKWKHNAWISYANDDFAITLTQIFRNGYKNQALPGIANGTVTRPDYNPRVSDYVIYNLSASLLSLRPGFKLTAGIRNLLDKDPPFAISYDSNSGAGGSWEPRVADPRGRSFTLQAEVKY
jgi:iron complex outermembrane receptor protein